MKELEPFTLIKGMSRLKAYTLLEVLIGITISSILIMMCYSGYQIFSNYFQRMDKHNQFYSRVITFNEVFTKQWDEADIISLNDENNLTFEGNSFDIWSFDNAVIIENDHSQYSFFKVNHHFYWKNRRLLPPLIDSIHITVYKSPADSLRLRFAKLYLPNTKLSIWQSR